MMKVVNKLLVAMILLISAQPIMADIWDNGTYLDTRHGSGSFVTFDVQIKVNDSESNLIGGLLRTDTDKVRLDFFDAILSSNYISDLGSRWIEGRLSEDGDSKGIYVEKQVSYDTEYSGHYERAFISVKELCPIAISSSGERSLLNVEFSPKLTIVDDDHICYLPEDNIIDGKPTCLGLKTIYINSEIDYEDGDTYLQWVNDTIYVGYTMIEEFECTKHKIQLLSPEIKWTDNKWLHYEKYDNKLGEMVPAILPVSIYETGTNCFLKFEVPIEHYYNEMYKHDASVIIMKGEITDGKIRFANYQNVCRDFGNNFLWDESFDDTWFNFNLLLNTETYVIDRPFTGEPEVMYVNSGDDLFFDYDPQNKTLSNPTSGFSVCELTFDQTGKSYHVSNPRILNTADPTGVEEIEEAECGIRYQNGIISSDLSKQIVVYSTDGAEIESEYTDRLDLTHLPKGIYIVRTGNNSLKIVR